MRQDRNAGKLPKRPVIGNGVLTPVGTLMVVPSCPECGEPTYDEPDCPFCGQPFIYDGEAE